MARSQKSLLLPATRSQCKSPGDGGVPAQPLPADPPASPPGTTSSRQTARTQPQHPPVKEREGREDFTPLPKGFILCQGWGGPAPHPGSPEGWVSAAVVLATWVGSRGPLISGTPEHLCFPPHGQEDGGWGGSSHFF